MTDLASTPHYWRVELFKLRRRGYRPGPTAQRMRRLSPAERVEFYNSDEIISGAARRGDLTALADMRRAIERQPAGDLRTLVLADIDSRLARHVATQRRQRQSTGRTYHEVRTGAAGVITR